jgi:predicted dehydrogenase
LAQNAGRKITVGHVYQFDPAARRMRDLISAGTVGRPIHLEALLGYDLEGTFGWAFINNPHHWIHRLPGKLFQNVISHLVAKIAEYMEDETPQVQVYSRRQSALLADKGIDVPDELRVMVAGEQMTAYLTFSAPGQQLLLFRVYGDKRGQADDQRYRFRAGQADAVVISSWSQSRLRMGTTRPGTATLLLRG